MIKTKPREKKNNAQLILKDKLFMQAKNLELELVKHKLPKPGNKRPVKYY